MIIIVLLFSFLANADLIFSFQGQSGESDRYYRPLSKEFTLTQHKKIRVLSKVNEDHLARNNLELSLQCTPRNYKKIYSNESFCGLTHITYNNSSAVITLHYTSYNPAVASGDCSGETYTVTVSTKEHCDPTTNNKKSIERGSDDNIEGSQNNETISK